MLLKFTSRKIHARHVSLSSDLTELTWGVDWLKGRNQTHKALVLSDIDRIVIGEPPSGPSRFHSNTGKQVGATALRVSEKLSFLSPSGVDQTSATSTAASTGSGAIAMKKGGSQNKNNKLTEGSKREESSGAFQSQSSQSNNNFSILSRLFKEKDEKERGFERDKKSLDQSSEHASIAASMSAHGEGSLNDFPHHRGKRYESIV